MKALKVRPQRTMQLVQQAPVTSNRREAERTYVDFKLMYAGEDAARQLILGDGVVTDLSSNGLRIRGNEVVRSGMELTLFLYLPDGRDPLFVMEARVAWAVRRQFGVRFLRMDLRERNRLHSFLRAHGSCQTH
jgi:hypothetical protein